MPLTFRTTPTGYQQASYNQLIVTTITNLTATSTVAGQIVLTWSGGAGYNVQYSYAVSTGTIQSTSGTNPTSITLSSTNTVTTTVTLTETVLGGSTSAVSNSVTTYTLPSGLTDINSTSIPYPYTNPPITSNYGNNFINTTLSNASGYAGISCSANGQYIVIPQSNVGIWVSNDYGVTWTNNYAISVTFFNNNIYNSPVVSSSGKYVYVLASNGLNYSSNYGVSFINYTTLFTTGTSLIFSISFNEKYAFISNANILYYSSDFGNTFNTTSQFGTTSNIYLTAALSYTGAIQCVNIGTTVYVSLDFGSTWTTYASGFLSVSKLRISADGKYISFFGGYTSGTTLAIGIGTWNGTSHTWVKTDSLDPTHPFRDFKMSFTGRYMIAASYTTGIFIVMVSNDYGVTWTSSTIPSFSNTHQTILCSVSLNGQYMTLSYIDNATGVGIQNVLFLESNDYGATFTIRKTFYTPNGNSTVWLVPALSADGYYQYLCPRDFGGFVSQPTFSTG